MTTSAPSSHTPPHTPYFENELLACWQQLPPSQRAGTTLVLLQDVLAGDYGFWVRDVVMMLLRGCV